ncbi:MAG: hypothetical protein JW882_10695 [Deltaproteobacteria bacterium]|nr:hypothetical protein [Deltaproteobacteria bacterium]
MSSKIYCGVEIMVVRRVVQDLKGVALFFLDEGFQIYPSFSIHENRG